MNVNQQQRAQQPPYIGSKISLISKLDIRYEGTLYTVDAIESTIALAKVRSYGTEDRHTPVYVPPRDEVYDFIIFKASDIKDLIVCELPKIPNMNSPLVTGLPYDPAIVSISKNPPPEPKLPTKLNNMNYSKSAEVPKRPGEFERDYDFEKANELFRVEEKSGEEKVQKGEMGQWTMTEKKVTPTDNDGEEVMVFYNKHTSFFDNISCDALEKEAGKNVRPDWKRERQTNQETFGHSAVRSLFFQRRGSVMAARGGGAHNYAGARAYGTARVCTGNRGYNGPRGYGGSLGYGSALVYGGALGYGGGTNGYGGAR